APFDLNRLQVGGAAISILSNVAGDFRSAGLQFSASGAGSIVYLSGVTEVAEAALVRVDRSGTARPLHADRRPVFFPSFSPEGRRVAVAIADGGNFDIWIYGADRGTLTRLTLDPTAEHYPLRRPPDGKYITLSSNRDGPFNLYLKAVDGTGGLERLTTSPN